MNRIFLVASDDEPVSAWTPIIVSASSKEQAIDRYLRVEYSKDPIFRQFVLDLTIDGSFLEKFFFATPEDNQSFDATGKIDFDLDLVKSRVMSFFAARPDLGEQYVSYMDTRDSSCINEEVYQFISSADPSGIVALDMGELRHL